MQSLYFMLCDLRVRKQMLSKGSLSKGTTSNISHRHRSAIVSLLIIYSDCVKLNTQHTSKSEHSWREIGNPTNDLHLHCGDHWIMVISWSVFSPQAVLMFLVTQIRKIDVTVTECAYKPVPGFCVASKLFVTFLHTSVSLLMLWL